MPHTDFMIRVEALMAETGCTRELASQAVIANYPKPGRTETKEERILRRAVAIMRQLGCGRGRAFAIARETVE